MKMKELTIITGPPGAGKSTYGATLGLPIYDTDLGNKDEWPSSDVDCILMASAPSAKQKTYWLSRADKAGFQTKLLAIMPSRMVCYARMKQRSGLSPDQRNNLEKDIERWFKLYSRHPAEEQRT